MTDYVPHTDDDRREMLNTIGMPSMESLFEDIPSELRFPELDLPTPRSERELADHVSGMAARNSQVDLSQRFLGAGSYYHHIPAAVDDAITRSEFYTSYTPYQPELSQGLLQATFEYQSMICRLTGMEISNASHYDGASALAEAVLMAIRLNTGAKAQVLMAHSVNPDMQAVVDTYLQGTEAVTVSVFNALDDLNSPDLLSPETAAVVVQQPDFFGSLHHLQKVADAAHSVGALLIVVVDPLSLALFKPPGDYGADIVVAEGQSLGLPPVFGGPGLGILATHKRFARQLAGRLVGETVDVDGNRGYVLTLATREQHIRRAGATSNICTNAALSALRAAIYLSVLGKQGMWELANICYQRAHYAAKSLDLLSGVIINPEIRDAVFFREFVVQLPQPASIVLQRLLNEFNIIGGYDLGQRHPDLGNCLLVTVTDVNSRQAIDALVAAIEKIIST